MNRKGSLQIRIAFLLTAVLLFLILVLLLRSGVPNDGIRHGILAVCGGVFLLAALRIYYQRWQVNRFADELCQTLDNLIAGRQPEQNQLYEDTLNAKVQGKLLQYHDIMSEGKLQSGKDKQTIQTLVSDISHQVKTPVANIRIFTGILQQHQLDAKKRAEFWGMLEGQVNKLDFLLQALIKMSRLETGTFTLHMENANVSNTIAEAMSVVWARAESRNIQLSVECDSAVTVKHDPKWTAEALGNILDNAVKYTPEGGSITITVRPWQFYTRITITDTGIGIEEEHCHDVFRRFYRTQEAAAQEGIGLGLYLANGIITRQNGYISLKSKKGEGTTFSVHLLS